MGDCMVMTGLTPIHSISTPILQNMKDIAFSCILALATLCATGGTSFAEPLFEEDFESYETGDLSGQEDWQTPESCLSPQIVKGSKTNTTKVAGPGLEDSKPAIATLAFRPDWKGKAAATFTMDILKSGKTQTKAGFVGTCGRGMVFGFGADAFQFQEAVAAGTPVILRKSNGAMLTGEDNVWYRITVRFTPATNTIESVLIENLTDKGNPVEAYFEKGEPTYIYATDETTWKMVQVRTGKSDEPGYIDNLSLTQEP